jgi:hypothetical protein
MSLPDLQIQIQNGVFDHYPFSVAGKNIVGM